MYLLYIFAATVGLLLFLIDVRELLRAVAFEGSLDGPGSIVDTVLHVLVLLAVPPLLLGVIAKTKACSPAGSAPPVLQPYYDLISSFGRDRSSARPRPGCSSPGRWSAW